MDGDVRLSGAKAFQREICVAVKSHRRDNEQILESLFNLSGLKPHVLRRAFRLV
jgi:hypothetical protein